MTMVLPQLILAFLLYAAASLALVLPNPADHIQYNALIRLNPMHSYDKLVCKASTQRMQCYGSPFVGIETCASSCTCEDGHISCPSYSHCDDSIMDLFCGSICQCGSSPGSSWRGRSGREFVPSAHRSSAQKQEADDDDDYSAEEDDDESRKRTPFPPGVNAQGL